MIDPRLPQFLEEVGIATAEQARKLTELIEAADKDDWFPPATERPDGKVTESARR